MFKACLVLDALLLKQGANSFLFDCNTAGLRTAGLEVLHIAFPYTLHLHWQMHDSHQAQRVRLATLVYLMAAGQGLSHCHA